MHPWVPHRVQPHRLRVTFRVFLTMWSSWTLISWISYVHLIRNRVAFSCHQNVCHGFAVAKKAPLSNEKVTVGNHDFVDVGTGVISMNLVVLVMKESVLFCAWGIQQARNRSNAWGENADWSYLWGEVSVQQRQSKFSGMRNTSPQ